MSGYTRQSVADIIANAIIKAAPVNAEFNAIRDAFSQTIGHKHDGTSAEGHYIPFIADADNLNRVVVDTVNSRIQFFADVGGVSTEQVRIQDGAIVPVTDNDIDLGAVGAEFKDLHLDGIGYIDTLTVHENATIAGTLSVTGLSTLPTVDIDGGNIDGTTIGSTTPAPSVTTSSLTATTADVNGGTIDDTTIGGTTPAAGDFTDVVASSIKVGAESDDDGKMTWNSSYKTVDLNLANGVVLQMGQEQHLYAKNISGTTLADGAVVRVTGASGNKITVDLANAAFEGTSSATIGVATQSVSNNVEGYFTTQGMVHDIDTSAFAEGAALWLGVTDGVITTTKPTSPNHLVHIGWCVRSHAVNGSIYVKVNNGWELDEVHDVLITSVGDGDGLRWNATAGVWENSKQITATSGTLDGVSIGATDVATSLAVDNLKLDGRTLSSTDANGNINVTPAGTGAVVVSKVDIGSGTIDGTTIGASSHTTIKGTTVEATTGFTGDLTGNVTASSGSTTLNNLTVNGTVDVTTAAITNVADPTNNQDAATKKYVEDRIADVVAVAPAALDTLNEIAASIADDSDFAGTMTTSLAGKVSDTGDSMTGNLDFGGTSKVTGLATPTASGDAVNKGYTDTLYGSVSSAATSASNALADRILVQDVYDNFDDRWLGDKATDPTLDNDGNALQTGASYFDSTNNILKIWNGTEWQAASSSIEGIRSVFNYTATAGQTVFSGADDNTDVLVIDKAELVDLVVNSFTFIQGEDYTVNASLDSVTLTTALVAGDDVQITVYGNFAGQSGADVAITGGSITGLTTLQVGASDVLTDSDIGVTVQAYDADTAKTDVAQTYTADQSHGDNVKATFGASDDLQIYHDGGGSYISDQGTGNLFVQAGNFRLQNPAGTETYILANQNGEVNLYYDNSKKLATTSTGVDVTGTVTADGLDILVDADDRITFTTLSGDALINSLNNTYSAYQPLLINGSDLRFLTGATERARIDSSGNVGIGTISPAQNLHISASTDTRIALENTSNRRYDLISGDSGEFRIWDTAVGERARIDSSGNLLVGKTSTSFSTEGAYIGQNGKLVATRANGSLQALNRTGSDGPIAEFYKDGSTVGSIGVEGGDLIIGTGDTGFRYVDSQNAIIPVNPTTGASLDNTIDMGNTNNSFKDLHLSGGVYLGGTGEANKLDDYETGTFTPNIIVGSTYYSPSVTHFAKYVKVGNIVHCHIWASYTSIGGNSGDLMYFQLPFVGGNYQPTQVGIGERYSTSNLFVSSGAQVVTGGTIENNNRLLLSDGGVGFVRRGSLNASGDLMLTVTYMA